MILIPLASIVVILLGVLAVQNLIIAKKPEAKQFIDLLIPIQGWLGLGACILGLWTIIHFFIKLYMVKYLPLFFICYLLTGIVLLGLGFVMGYGLIAKLTLGKSEQAKAKGQQLVDKLAKFQAPLGIIGLVLGALLILFFFISA